MSTELLAACRAVVARHASALSIGGPSAMASTRSAAVKPTCAIRPVFQGSQARRIFSPAVKRSNFNAGDAVRPIRRSQTGLPHSPQRTFHWSRSRRSKNEGAKEGAKEDPIDSTDTTSIRARFRKLSREYGWAAVGVYAALSVLDFPFCFMLVRIVGTDRIASAEHWVLSKVEMVIPQSAKDWWHNYRAAVKEAEVKQFGNNNISQDVEMVGWGVQEAEQKHKAGASLGTQLALAYAIHKSFIFVRVPLTAAVTPKVVKILRGWGWQIGKKPLKPS